MARFSRLLTGLLIVYGGIAFVAGVATVIPLWADGGLAALIVGLVAAYLGSRASIVESESDVPEAPKRVLSSSSRLGVAELAGAIAEVHGLETIACVQCLKAISREEWPDHVNWHRLAEMTPPGPSQ